MLCQLCSVDPVSSCCVQSCMLPELRNGDWLVFPAMGAYTLCGASDFNGIAATRVPTFYVHSVLAAAAGDAAVQ